MACQGRYSSYPCIVATKTRGPILDATEPLEMPSPKLNCHPQKTAPQPYWALLPLFHLSKGSKIQSCPSKGPRGQHGSAQPVGPQTKRNAQWIYTTPDHTLTAPNGWPKAFSKQNSRWSNVQSTNPPTSRILRSRVRLWEKTGQKHKEDGATRSCQGCGSSYSLKKHRGIILKWPNLFLRDAMTKNGKIGIKHLSRWSKTGYHSSGRLNCSINCSINPKRFKTLGIDGATCSCQGCGSSYSLILTSKNTAG